MKKIANKTLVVFLLILIFIPSIVSAVIIDGKDIKGNMIKIKENGTSLDQERAQMIAELQNNFGYEGTTLQKQMILKPIIEITEETTPGGMAGPSTKYRIIKIGGHEVLRSSTITDDDIKKSYGWDGASTSWDCSMIVSKGDEGHEVGGEYGQYLYLKIDKLFTGEDIDKVNEEEIDTSPMELALLEQDEAIDEMYDNIADFINSAINFKNNLKHNPTGTVLTCVLDAYLPSIDKTQQMVNSFQKDDELVFSYKRLSESSDDEGPITRNMYANVSKGDENKGDDSWQEIRDVDINNTDLKNFQKFGFSEKTKIPVVTVDITELAQNKVNKFDVNFLVVNNEIHESTSKWSKLRRVVFLIIRITLYLSSSLLVLGLIWYSIQLITRTALTPSKRVIQQNAMNRFAKSCLMFIGTIVIMAIAIYGGQMLYTSVAQTMRTEQRIRVNVEEAGYSFSTNRTGYIRYMAQIENVDLSSKKLEYVLKYRIITLVNLLFSGFMLIRTFLMWVLAIVGPLIVVCDAFDLKNIFNMSFKKWAVSYLELGAMQVVLVLYCLINGLIYNSL